MNITLDYIKDYGNVIMNDLMCKDAKLNEQLLLHNGVTFIDYSEYNLAIAELEDEIKTFKDVMQQLNDKLHYANLSNEEKIDVETKLLIAKFKLNELNTSLMFHRSRSHSLNRSFVSYIEKEDLGGIKYGK